MILGFLGLYAPIAVLTKNKHKSFCLYWIVCYMAQCFMYMPGSDISPYNYSLGGLISLKFFGLTLSAISCIILLEFVVVFLLLNRTNKSRKGLIILGCAILPNLIALLITDDITASIDYMIKMGGPFIVFFWSENFINKNNVAYFRKTISLINIIMIGQVILCKLLTGSTNAYNYYYELND